MAFNNKTKTLQPRKSSAQLQNEIMRKKMFDSGLRRHPETMRGTQLKSAFVSAFNVHKAKTEEDKGVIDGIVDRIKELVK